MSSEQLNVVEEDFVDGLDGEEEAEEAIETGLEGGEGDIIRANVQEAHALVKAALSEQLPFLLDTINRKNQVKGAINIKLLIEREFSGDGDLEQALELVRASRAIPRTRELAETFAREAREALAWLPESPSRRALLDLPDFVLGRLY